MKIRCLASSLLLMTAPLSAQTAQNPPSNQTSDRSTWPSAWFEIFRLAPGQHEAFVRRVALADEAARAGGQPPLRLYFHQEGADWDVLILKPVGENVPTPEQQKAIAARSKELGIPTGAAYFADLRTAVSSHSDTLAAGPISADQWLADLDQWRREEAGRIKSSKSAARRLDTDAD